MELEEYLQNNNVTLWRNNRALGPQQTKSLADFDYAEGLENITVKFEDGFVLYHARWNQFVRGALHHNQKNINE